jgi:LacI family transcriptional regulator
MARKITMQDIADRLNVSKNSVSQALSGKPGVSEETRNLIIKTAESIGYHYTSKKSPFSKPAIKNIALIASDFAFSRKSFFGEIYLSIEKELSKRGMNLFIQSIDQHSKENLLIPPLFDHQEIEGVIILSHISKSYTEKIISTGLPTIIIDHHFPTLQADAILTNNRFSAYEAVRYLIDLGHRDIAFLGDIDFSPSYYERLEGFKLAFYEMKLPINHELIFSHTEENEESIFQVINGLSEHPTAWFCVNDGLGFYVNSALQQKGLKVPEDVSICSFDNGDLSRISTPKLTTVAIDLEYFGKKAVEQMMWRAENPLAPFQEILLPATLIKRGSTIER